MNKRYRQQLFGGDHFSVFLSKDNKIFMSGDLPNKATKLGPTLYEIKEKVKIVNVACGEQDCCFLDSTGVVYSSKFFKVKIPEKIVSLAGGDRHFCFISKKGNVFGNGDTRYFFGQIYVEQYYNQKNVPLLESVNVPNKYFIGEIIKSVSCGSRFTIYVTKNGDCYSIGGNGSTGNLGHGDTLSKKEMRYSPQRIDFFHKNNIKIEHVETGIIHTIFMTTDKRLYGCGDNSACELFEGGKVKQTMIPVLINTLPEKPSLRTFSTGNRHSILLMDNGEIYTAGWGYAGRLGNSSGKNESVPLLIKLKNVKENIVQVFAGGTQSLIMTESGKILSCGWNGNGQLGVGDKRHRNVFVPIKNFFLEPWQLVECYSIGNVKRYQDCVVKCYW